MSTYSMRHKPTIILLLIILIIFTCVISCSHSVSAGSSSVVKSPNAALRDSVPRVLYPVAEGTDVSSSDVTAIDFSNSHNGYVCVKYTGDNNKVKMQLKKTGSAATYTYNIFSRTDFETFPFSEGSGEYTVSVFENISDDKYSLEFSDTIDVELITPQVPFLYPNQFVSFNKDSKPVSIAVEVVKNATDDVEAIEAIYNYVISNITYDHEAAANVQSGYIPDLDKIMVEKKGICFDYASVMVSMLRSQRIPAQLVFGYSGSAYHAWINIYLNEIGWVNGLIYFDGHDWVRMDPTFAATSKDGPKIEKFIGNGSNYKAMYYY